MSRWATVLIMVGTCLWASCGPRDITIGSDSETSGNYWGRNVSREFDRPELEALYKVMNGARTKAEIMQLHCGRVLPPHEYSVTLWPEGSYRERIVRLQMTPRLYADDDCLQQVVNYVFQRNVKSLDSGPPVDYGYKDPMTGKPLGPSEELQRIPDKPTCPCAASNSSLPAAATASHSR